MNTPKKESQYKKLNQKIDSVHAELNQKIDHHYKELSARIDSLDQKVGKLAVEVINLKEEVVIIKETMMTKQDVQKIIEHIDGFARRVETYDGKTLVQDRRLLYLENHFSDHEKRIQKIETILPK